MNGKRYFNETKKKYGYITSFQGCIIIFPQNHQNFNTLPPRLRQFLKPVLKKFGVLFLEQFPHCTLHLTQRITVLTSTH